MTQSTKDRPAKLRLIGELCRDIAKIYQPATAELEDRRNERDKFLRWLENPIDHLEKTELQLRLRNRQEDYDRQLRLCAAWWGKVKELSALTEAHLPAFGQPKYVSMRKPWHESPRFNWPEAIRELADIEAAVLKAQTDQQQSEAVISNAGAADILGVKPSRVSQLALRMKRGTLPTGGKGYTLASVQALKAERERKENRRETKLV